jgi:hypothetical protein
VRDVLERVVLTQATRSVSVNRINSEHLHVIATTECIARRFFFWLTLALACPAAAMESKVGGNKSLAGQSREFAAARPATVAILKNSIYDLP